MGVGAGVGVGIRIDVGVGIMSGLPNTPLHAIISHKPLTTATSGLPNISLGGTPSAGRVPSSKAALLT